MNFNEFHFLRPWWLLALLPALLLLVLLLKNRRSRGDWTTVCDAELLPFILLEKPTPARRGSLTAAGLAALLSILALAGPSWERLPSPAFRNDAALVIAMDLSKSMDASDIKPSRISRARYKIADILKMRKDGQTALLVYGGDAFTVTPLTNDVATINSQLEALTTDIMPSPGRNTGLAIEKAADLLHQAGLAKGHILLVTDGVAEDSADRASGILGDYQLSILAVGTEDGAPIPGDGGGFMQDAKGSILVARLNGSALTELATVGRGIFQKVTADDNDIKRLAETFNGAVPGETAQNDNLLLQQWDDKGSWLVLLVLPWAALRFRKGLLSLAVLCCLPAPQDAQALDWQSLWKNPDQRGLQAFNQQQFEQAAGQFDNPEWRAAAQYKAGQYQQAAETLKDSKTADGQYNRGNALAKAGQLQDALAAYNQALQLDAGHADAKYNKELVEKHLKDQQKQQGDDQQQPDQQDKEQNQQDKQDDSQQQNRQQQKDQQTDKPGQDQQNPEDEAKDPQQQPQNDNQQKQPQPVQDKPQPIEDKPAGQQQPAETEKADSETDRANEQLLKRIPDEPTGLLKRKFKYQYGQRGKAPQRGPEW